MLGRLPRTRPGRVPRAAALALVALLLAATPVGAVVYPSSLAATGDSITRAYNDGSLPYADYPAGSWSTGTDSRVASLYSRLLAVNPAISGRTYNDAKSGAKVADLRGQLVTVASRNVDAVTILIGGNDVCTSSEATMTTVDAFRTSFQTAFNDFTTASPATTIYVASIPNIYNLWQIFKNNSTARSVWSLFKVCPSMLANPTSTQKADVDRRQRVLQRERDFNAVMRDICLAYARCRYDGDAVFSTAFTTSDVTTRDYFHPSISGQKKLAAGTWAVWFAP